ncbi:MAG: DUF1573 domain-containing protein [Bacillota bacterium]
MEDILSDDFQKTVAECTIRHRSILDILAKHQEAAGRVNRAVCKAATSCGCIMIQAHKPEIPEDISLQQLPQFMSSHIQGELCEECRETLETEIGLHLFYVAALCNTFNLNMHDIMLKERMKLLTLGIFNMS